MIHVLPVDDTRDGAPFEHEETTTCPCAPSVERVGDGFLVVHNSFDGREAVEWANAVLSPDPE